MPKFYAKKKSRMILEKMEHSFVVKSNQGIDGYLHGKPGMFRVCNEDDPHHHYGIVDNDYIDRHYEVEGQVEADGLQESPDAIVDPPPSTVSVEEPKLPTEDAPPMDEPTTDPEDAAR